MGITTLSSGIRALDLRAMATDGASGAQGAKITEISPYSHPSPRSFQPPRPPDPEDVRRRLLIEREERLRISREETAAFCHKVQQNTAAYTSEVEAFRSEMSTSFREMQLRLSAQFDALMARLEPAGNPSLRFGCFGSLPPPSDSPVPRARGTTPSSTDGLSLSMFVGNSASSGSETPQSGLLPTPASYYAPPPQPSPHPTCVSRTHFAPVFPNQNPKTMSDPEIAKTQEERKRMEQQMASMNSVAYDAEFYGATDKADYVSSIPVENDGVRRMASYTAPKSLIHDMPRGVEEDEASGMPRSRKIIDREDDYRRRRLNRNISLERHDPFAAGEKTPDPSVRTYAEIMREEALKREKEESGKAAPPTDKAAGAQKKRNRPLTDEEPDAVEKHGSNVNGFILDEDYPCPVSNFSLQVTLHDELSQDGFAPVSLCHSDKAGRVVSEAAKLSFASTAIVDSHGLLDSDSWEDISSTGHLHDQMQPILLEQQVATFSLDIAGERVVDVPDDLTRAWGKTLPLGALIASDQYGSSDSKTVAAIMIIANEMGENSNDGDESLSLMDKWQHNWVQDTGGGTQFLFGAPSSTTIFPQSLIDRVFCRRSLGILNVGYCKLLLEFNFGLRPGGYFLQPASSISHKFQGVAAMKVTYNDRAPNQLPPPCYKCSMLVWNYSEKIIGCVPQVTQLQLVQELMKIGVLQTVLCNQIIGDIGKAEYRHIGIYLSIAWERCAQMYGRESSADHSAIIVNCSHSHPRDGYSGSLWPYSLFCLARMGLLSLCQEVSTHVGTLKLDGNISCLPIEDKFDIVSLFVAGNLERIGQKRLLKQFVVVMFVNKNAKCVARGSITRELCEVEAKQMAHDLIPIRNHISFQGMMSLLQVISAVAYAKFKLHVILLVCLQGDGNTIIVNTLHMALLSCHGQLRDASFLFASGLNDSLQVNSALSSLSHSFTPTVLIAGDVHSIVHLTSQAWSSLAMIINSFGMPQHNVSGDDYVLGKANLTSEEREQLGILNVNFQYIRVPWTSKINGGCIAGGELNRSGAIDQLAILSTQVLMITSFRSCKWLCEFQYSRMALLVYSIRVAAIGMELLVLPLQCPLHVKLQFVETLDLKVKLEDKFH